MEEEIKTNLQIYAISNGDMINYSFIPDESESESEYQGEDYFEENKEDEKDID